VTTWRDMAVKAASFGVVAAWAVACAWLLAQGRYTAFLAPMLWPLLAAAVVMLLLMLGAMAGMRPGGASPWSRLVTLGWVALPLAYLTAAPATGLDSYALVARGSDPLASVSVATGPQRDAAVNHDDEDENAPPAEVSLLHLLIDMQRYEGRRVSAIGMVHRDARTSQYSTADHFVLFRFVVACCAADASPVGAMVRVADAELYEANTWVRITGRVELVPIGLDRGPCIVADEIVPIDPPFDLYLSPW
jgi:putative membrane protein